MTIKPNGGDTGKTLFIPNAGVRNYTNGTASGYGSEGHSWTAEEITSNTTTAWNLFFYSGITFGSINTYSKLYAKSIRCVRS